LRRFLASTSASDGKQRLFELPIELAERLRLSSSTARRTSDKQIGLRLPALHRFLGTAQKVDGLDARNRLAEAVAIEDLGRRATKEGVRPDQLVDGRGLQVQLLAVVLLEGDEAPLGVALALFGSLTATSASSIQLALKRRARAISSARSGVFGMTALGSSESGIHFGLAVES
jgi:hypothetical protein